MEVLAFFGAFNPPTIAHINLAREAMDKCHLEKVIFVPSQDSYVRTVQKKSFSFSNKQRLDMLHAIAKNRSWMMVDDEELSCDHQPRTYDTLCSLDQRGYHAHLLMGSDKLKELQTGWKHVPEIVHQFGIVCMSRSHDDARNLIQNGMPVTKACYESGFKNYSTFSRAYKKQFKTPPRYDIMSHALSCACAKESI